MSLWYLKNSSYCWFSWCLMLSSFYWFLWYLLFSTSSIYFVWFLVHKRKKLLYLWPFSMGYIKRVGHLRKVVRKICAFQKENDESNFGS